MSRSEERMAVIMPHMMDWKPREANESEMSTQLDAVKLVFYRLYCTTVLKRIMETASLVIPSPKTSEKSFGCLSGLMRDTAAMTSVEQSRLHMRMTSSVDKSRGDTSPVYPLVCVRLPM